MEVNVLHYTPLEVIDKALTKCWDSECKEGQAMLDRIDRIGNKFKHESILEHCTVNFEIKGISRACLQELARHRMQNMSVKSTRYTLKELKNNCYFTNSNPAEGTTYRWGEIKKYIVLTGNEKVDEASANALIDLKFILEDGVSNDKAKYCIPESYKTDLSSTMNIRALKNFLSLRTDKAALWEIRELANKMFDILPEEHKFLLKDSVKEYNE